MKNADENKLDVYVDHKTDDFVFTCNCKARVKALQQFLTVRINLSV